MCFESASTGGLSQCFEAQVVVFEGAQWDHARGPSDVGYHEAVDIVDYRAGDLFG